MSAAFIVCFISIDIKLFAAIETLGIKTGPTPPGYEAPVGWISAYAVVATVALFAITTLVTTVVVDAGAVYKVVGLVVTVVLANSFVFTAISYYLS
jgi:hypothetical protein